MRVQQGRPARPGIFSCGEHVVAVGGADNGKIGCQVWSLLLRGSGMGGGTSLWSRNVTLSLSLILRVTWWSPSKAPLSTLVWDLRILRVKVMRQCPPSGLSSLGSSWFIRTDNLSLWGLTLMLSRCRVGLVTGDVARAGGASADVACSYAAAALRHPGTVVACHVRVLLTLRRARKSW